MKVQSIIEDKVREALQPQHLEVINESGNHNVPAGSESHFKLVVVADAFEGKALVARHREINGVLEKELREDIHALALHTLTPAEWAERGGAPTSPPCLGGGKG